MFNERLPEFHEAAHPSFPTVQAPSTRVRRPAHAGAPGGGGSADDMDLEAKFRRTLSRDEEDEDDQMRDVRALAERIARTRRPGRPTGLKRHETV